MGNGVRTGEEIKKAAYGALVALTDNLPRHVKLAVQDVDEIVISALEKHGEHLSTHAISQGHLDPLKLVCWLGRAIIERLEHSESYHQHETVLSAIIATLEEILFLETKGEVIITATDRTLLMRLAMEEIKGNGDHGIGFNGLFVAFHCFRSTHLQISSRRN